MYMPRTDPQRPEASPLWREDFMDCMRTYYCEFDPHCDEGEAYQQFREQGGMHLPALSRCHPWLFQLGGVSERHESAMRDVAACCRIHQQAK